MSTKTKVEKHAFQTEVKQLLHLMIHSLYTNKEIFLRELISNASDACDKLRYEALTDNSLFEDDDELQVQIELDDKKNTITIRDNGVGMSRDEVVSNIGTIAQSGTKTFIEKMNEAKEEEANLIGQFGVGFYSAFLVSKSVELTTRCTGEKSGTKWVSSGDGEYTLEEVAKESRGTEIKIKFNKDSKEFAGDYRIREIIRKYSNHISMPIMMLKMATPAADGDKDKSVIDVPEWEQVNGGTPIWARPRNEIEEDEYNSFYTGLSYDPKPPAVTLHNRVEGNLEYNSLFFIPSRAPFDLWDREQRNGVKLYVKRVFIADNKNLMPNYLRFIRGLVDAQDLPLNISREFLQGNPQLEKIRAASTKKVLGELKKLAKKDAEKYQGLWKEFGKAIKEGIAEDHGNHDRITPLLRFASTHNDNDQQNVSFEEYAERAGKDQSEIYYITADSYAAAAASPHLEVFKKKGKEVLLLSDPIDEWVVNQLNDINGKALKSIAKGDIDLGESKEDTEEAKKEETIKPLLEKLKELLGAKVKDVKISNRLVDSPCCLIAEENAMGGNMERIMKAMGQDMPAFKPILEINPDHALVTNLSVDQDNLEDWANLLFDQAALAEGAPLKDPGNFVKRINKLLMN